MDVLRLRFRDKIIEVSAEKAKRGGIRWIIGTLDGARSSTWRLWANKKGDVYISRRGAGGIYKVSFHRDGNCQIGFTSDYEETAKKLLPLFPSRHWYRWKVPDEQTVRALQIVVPHSEMRAFPSIEEEQTAWIPAPPHDSVSVVSIFFAKPGTEEIWPGAAEGIKPLGVLTSPKRITWAVFSDNPIDDDLRAWIEHNRLRVANDPKAGDAPRKPGTRVMVWGSRGEGDLYLLELAWDHPQE
jgi:hypothetical protein